MTLLRVTRMATEVASEAALEEAREHFAQRHHLHLKGFLAPDLCALITAGIERAEYTPFRHATGAVDFAMAEGPELDALHFSLSDPGLIRVVERLSGRAPLTSLHGRVYRMVEGPHFDEWHDDLDGNRQVAITVNLGGPYAGGHLLMREYPSGASVFDIHNAGVGDAILFEIGENLEHTITQVTGPIPKTAFAGWFCTRPDRLAKGVFRVA